MRLPPGGPGRRRGERGPSVVRRPEPGRSRGSNTSPFGQSGIVEARSEPRSAAPARPNTTPYQSKGPMTLQLLGIRGGVAAVACRGRAGVLAFSNGGPWTPVSRRGDRTRLQPLRLGGASHRVPTCLHCQDPALGVVCR